MPSKSARAYANLVPEGAKAAHRWAFVYLDGDAEDAMSEYMQANGVWGDPDVFGADKPKPDVGVHDVNLLGQRATAFIWVDRSRIPGGLVVLDSDRSARSRAQKEFNKHMGHGAKSILAASIDKTTQRVMGAWEAAQGRMKAGESFYDALADELRDAIGVRWTESDIKGYFADWNRLSHTEALTIAEEHGVDVRKGGFQAFLAHQTHEGGRMARLSPRSLAAKFLGVSVKTHTTFIKSASGPKLPPEMDKDVKSAVEDAIDDVESNVEGSPSKVIEVGGRGFRFGSGSDGGYGAETYSPLSHLSASGNWGSNSQVTSHLEAAEERAHADGTKWWADKNKAFLAENDLAPDQLNYSDLYDLDFDEQAEDLDEAHRESMEEEYVTYRLGAFYYGPENTKEGKRGEHNMYVFGLISTEGQYLGNKSFTVYEKSFAFKDDRDMENKLQTALAQATSALA